MARVVGWSLLVAACLVAGWIWSRGSDTPSDGAGPIAIASSRAPSAAADEVLSPSPPQPDLAADSPEWRAYQASIAFRDEVREFFAVAEKLAPAERDARAAAIRDEVVALREQGRILPAEALLLELGLVRATEDDPAVVDHRIAEVVAAYEAVAAETASRAPDARDAQYQAQQDAIAREVMALDELPPGRTREEILRERLRALRLELYAGDTASE